MFPLPTKMKNYRARRVMDGAGLEAARPGEWVPGVNSYKPPGSFQGGRILVRNGREGATPAG